RASSANGCGAGATGGSSPASAGWWCGSSVPGASVGERNRVARAASNLPGRSATREPRPPRVFRFRRVASGGVVSRLDATEFRDRWARWAPLPVRMASGYGFMAHGWAKLSRGPAAFATLLRQIGMPVPVPTAWAVTLLELLGGLAVLAGAYVAVVSVPLIATMLVAMFKIHLRYGFSAIKTIGLTADGLLFG